MLDTKDILMRCSICKMEKSLSLNRSQIRTLAEGRLLQFHCTYCTTPQYWASVNPVTYKDEEEPILESPRSILVVDDDDLTITLLKKVLDTWKADIQIADNAKDALSKLSTQEFDLMICDIHMPGMTGKELYSHIRDNALLPPQRILFLTGDKSNSMKEFLDSSGCYYMFKPIQFLTFSDQVQDLLAGEFRK
ncbi:MAG: hypothetical protein A3F68_12780 [Acidobacteria bacterium RIFCSPLOWO2_12_FULL_54_10]|nr:MAG: hypothetical protein A3F68_12780 [Acidobacteria bacterium RIFCSPLOWO2_12_FULL_54_10]